MDLDGSDEKSPLYYNGSLGRGEAMHAWVLASVRRHRFAYSVAERIANGLGRPCGRFFSILLALRRRVMRSLMSNALYCDPRCASGHVRPAAQGISRPNGFTQDQRPSRIGAALQTYVATERPTDEAHTSSCGASDSAPSGPGHSWIFTICDASRRGTTPNSNISSPTRLTASTPSRVAISRASTEEQLSQAELKRYVKR